jgi:hypothetical protein
VRDFFYCIVVLVVAYQTAGCNGSPAAPGIDRPNAPKNLQPSLESESNAIQDSRLIEIAVKSADAFKQSQVFRVEYADEPFPYTSGRAWGKELQLLEDTHYIEISQRPYSSPTTPAAGWVPYYYWEPLPKAKAAMGKSIFEEEIQSTQGFAHSFRWTVALATPEFLQVDGQTPLKDGIKVEFSWRWKPTDMGTKVGLNDNRQRGEAYLQRLQQGWKIDRIYLKN